MSDCVSVDKFDFCKKSVIMHIFDEKDIDNFLRFEYPNLGKWTLKMGVGMIGHCDNCNRLGETEQFLYKRRHRKTVKFWLCPECERKIRGKKI